MAGLQSAENPHLPVETVSPGAADAAEPAEVEDEFFDSLALQRWSRPGHGDGPEPPTVVYRKGTSESAPVVILGGIPGEADLAMLERHRVRLVVTCFAQSAVGKGAVFPKDACVRHWVISSPKKRDRDWAELRPLLQPTLEHNSSIFVHCMAGVHRAPVATGIVVSTLKGQSLDQTMKHIGRLRAIEGHKMLGPAKEEFTKWANDKAEGDRLPPNYARVPLQFISADQPKALWHLVPVNFDPQVPKPLCQWKRTQTSFKGQTRLANSVQEALVYDRPFCSSCAKHMPAGALGELENAAVSWRSR